MQTQDYVWLWEGLIPAGGRALLFGEPKTGKSYLALGLAEAVANPTAATYLGQRILHGSVLYFQFDTPRTLWQRNYVARTRPFDAMWFTDREDPSLPPEFDIRRVDHGEWFADQIRQVRPTPVLVIADTLRALHQGDENDSTTMQAVMNALTRAAYPAALLLLAHDNKPLINDHRSSAARIRGSSYIAGAVDAILHLTRKGIRVAARSDVERIRAVQGDDGFFVSADRLDRVRELLSALPFAGKRARDKAIADALHVSERTARSLRLQAEDDD